MRLVILCPLALIAAGLASASAPCSQLSVSCGGCEAAAGCSWCNTTGQSPGSGPGFCRPSRKPADCIGTRPAACRANATPPLWPVSFSIDSLEAYSGKGVPTPVSWFYDSSVPAVKFVRPLTGRNSQDGICQGLDLPCVDLAVNGSRFIVHPTQGACCLLGTWAEGCGPVTRDWMRRNNATFQGRKRVDGVDSEEWDIQGFSLNKWFQETGSGVPVRMDQGTFVNVYNRTTWRPTDGPLPGHVFDIPAACHGAKFCPSRRPCNF